MINQQSIDACDKSHFGVFSKPLYDSYCFSRIPATLQKLLGIQTADTLPEDVCGTRNTDFLFCFLLDSFGWSSFEPQAAQSPFLQHFIQQGVVSKLTSQFPSTTTGHVTCIHTGLPVGLSGYYEWFCYDPLVDTVICPLQFSYAYAAGKQPPKINSLRDAGYEATALFSFPSIYEKLKEAGIASYIVQPKEITNTPYSKAVERGAESIGYSSLRDGLNKLVKAYQQTTAQKAYFFFYYPKIDSFGHEFGPEATETVKEIHYCLQQLEFFYQKLLTDLKPKTSLIVTADHGMTSLDPAKILYINQLMPELHERLQANKAGVPILPSGSCRDLFLHIQPGLVNKTVDDLRALLHDKAEVYTTQELLDKGLFGQTNQRLLQRLGTALILPYAPYSVWWHTPYTPAATYRGFHGGLSKQELEIPFLFQNLPLAAYPAAEGDPASAADPVL